MVLIKDVIIVGVGISIMLIWTYIFHRKFIRLRERALNFAREKKEVSENA